MSHLNTSLHTALSALTPPVAGDGEHIDTRSSLYQLASRTEVDNDDKALLDFISKRFDIAGKLFEQYSSDGKRVGDTQITDPQWLNLATLLFAHHAVNSASSGTDTAGRQLKRFNLAFKALSGDAGSQLPSEVSHEVYSAFANLLGKVPVQISGSASEPTGRGVQPQTLPLTVLFYEGPIARAYLETMDSLGLRPARIINLVSSKDLVTRKPVGKWLPGTLRTALATSSHRQKMHYWPQKLAKDHKGLVQAIQSALNDSLGISASTQANAIALRPLESFSNEVETLLVDGLHDPGLLQRLSEGQLDPILFTGGGIVPESLLSIEGLPFIHVHPGFLPEVRGADCTLWSNLVHGHTSASCFYMALGIDTGDIIKRVWLPHFRLPAAPADIGTRYRLVYGFVDPWVRCFALREFLLDHQQFADLPATPQDTAQGMDFHFMQERVREVALAVMFEQ